MMLNIEYLSFILDGQVFVKNFVHGDLHPGNILVQNADTFTEQV